MLLNIHLAAVETAWQQGAAAVEADVHLTFDNKIRVIHDKDARRNSETDLNIKKTPSVEFRKLDAGIFKSACFPDETPGFGNTLPISSKGAQSSTLSEGQGN